MSAGRPIEWTTEKKDKAIEIYCLKHPITKEIRYIGKSNDSSKRIKSHISSSKIKKTPVNQWINKLLKNNLKPEIEVLFETDIENWANDEIRTISEYKLKGYRLLNLAIGGNEPFCSKEVRQESGRKVAKLIHSDEKRKRLWYLKKELSAYISKLKKEGNIERYEHWITKIKNSKVNTYFNFNI